VKVAWCVESSCGLPHAFAEGAWDSEATAWVADAQTLTEFLVRIFPILNPLNLFIAEGDGVIGFVVGWNARVILGWSTPTGHKSLVTSWFIEDHPKSNKIGI